MKDIILKINNVNQWFGKNLVLHNLNIEIERGQFVALVGRSGCGKSTLLKGIHGTCIPKGGEILLENWKVLKPTCEIGMMYQHYNLYRFLTAEENAALGLKLNETSIWERLVHFKKWGNLRRQHLIKARSLLIRFGLRDALKQYPSSLSGGMRQRTSFVRSLIMKPKILLLDEPFGAQDENTRRQLQMALLKLYQENLSNISMGLPPKWTVIIITHETDEACYVSDRIIGLSRNWKQGDNKGEKLGATVVFDQPSPVYHPNDEKDFSLFASIKHDLHKFVLDEDEKNIVDMEEEKFITSWSDEDHIGQGVVI